MSTPIPRWSDTASQTLLPLTVPRGETVNIYACGITPYSAPHIGHARSFVVFDAFAKTLQYLGWKVDMVRNITDIDDKIIKQAHVEGTTWQELSSRWAEFNTRLFARLNVSPVPEPKVSTSMPAIVSMVKALIEKGNAYATPEGNVYFSVGSMTPTDLIHQSANDLKTRQGTGRVQKDDKQDAADFALWKSAPVSEPGWASPWSHGRPGWHIECSAMIEDHFHGPVHIHGGGTDLRFPHHQCEACQSEAYMGRPLASHWVHHGSVLHDGQKMSKSIGNVVLAEALLTGAEALLPGRGAVVARLGLLSAHWQKPLDWSDRVLRRAAKRVQSLEAAFQTRLHEEAVSWDGVGQSSTSRGLSSFRTDYQHALAQNFNTPLALGILEKAVTTAPLSDLWEALGALGLDRDFWPATFGLAPVSPAIEVPEDIQALVESREKARLEKDFAAADALRETLGKTGWQVEDSRNGPLLRRRSL